MTRVEMPSIEEGLLVRETQHRCKNDLQLVLALLTMQGRRAKCPETREAFADATARVEILAKAREGQAEQSEADLERALREVCEALLSQTEPRSILISFDVDGEISGLTSRQITVAALAVNELATNAIKHAFPQEGAGQIRVSVGGTDKAVLIEVDDDGVPLPDPKETRQGALGLTLTSRLLRSAGGSVARPERGSKCFTLTLPRQAKSSRDLLYR